MMLCHTGQTMANCKIYLKVDISSLNRTFHFSKPKCSKIYKTSYFLEPVKKNKPGDPIFFLGYFFSKGLKVTLTKFQQNFI